MEAMGSMALTRCHNTVTARAQNTHTHMRPEPDHVCVVDRIWMCWLGLALARLVQSSLSV